MRKKNFYGSDWNSYFLGVFAIDSLQIVNGPLFFNIAMAIVSFLMCHEFYKAMEAKDYKPIKFLGYLCTLFLIPIGVVQTRTLMMICAIIIPLIIFIGMATTVFSKLKYNVADVAITLLGAIYTVLMVAFLSATRAMPMGVFLIFYIVCGPWFSDIFAFLVGRKIGKHKFSEISPKKSIEGCIAGIFGTIIFFVVYSLCLSKLNFAEFKEASNNMSSIVQLEVNSDNEEANKLADNSSSEKAENQTKENQLASLDSAENTKGTQNNDLLSKATISDEYRIQQKLSKHFYSNYPILILLGLIVSVVSQIGDLSASGIKRYAGIKDFSHLMPGHGGMLDRFDSVLFVAPIMYYTFFIIAHL